ncbi:metalloregulator ArsR/SmtB family transcription factor [Desulfitobacterium sp. AusDCA]
MKELVEAGLVLEKARGKWKYYALNQPIIKEYIKQLEVDFKL